MSERTAAAHDSAVGILTVDLRLVVRTWDAWMAAASGIPAEAALGRPIAELVPDAEDRGILSRLRSVIDRGTVEILSPALHHYLLPCRPRPASSRFAEMQQHVSMGPLREQGRITGVVITVEDVTGRMERDRALADSVDSMTEALGDPQWTNRQRGVRRLAGQGQVIVSTLIQTLRRQHRDFSVLSSALDLLAMTDLDVVEPLAELLSDGDADLRVQAALILGERRDPRGIPALMRALDDPDVNVRFHAIEALGRLHATQAVEPLLAIAETREFFLAFPAIHALATLGDVHVARRLVPLLDDEMLSGAVVDALGVVGDEMVAAPLVHLLGQPNAPADAIADALSSLFERYERRYGAGDQIATLVRRAMTPAAMANLLGAIDRVASDRLPGIASVLGWLHGPAVERALARMLVQPSIRAQVVEALVRYGSGVVDLLVEQLEAGGDLEIRQAAAVALGRIGDRRATPALVAALDLDEPELAVPAAGALARIGDSAAFEPLMALIGTADSSVRQASIAALNSIGHVDMPSRVQALLDDPSELVRESAAKIAGYFGYRECLDGVIELCSDPSETVRRAAVEQLPMFDDDRAIKRLAQALVADTPSVRASAAAAFARVDGGVQPLVAALSDADPWVRYFAVRSLGAREDRSAAVAVSERLERDPAPQVRLAAIEALGRLAPADSLPVLEPLATSPDADTARAAMRAMRHVGGPRAHAALEALTRAADEWRRLEAVAALCPRGGTEAAGTLQWVAASDESAAVTEAAIAGLASMASRDDDAALPAARALVTLTAEPSRREPAVAALARLPVSRARDVAEGLTHAAPAVRRAVVEALSRMRHVDATRLIEQALTDAAPTVRAAAVAELRRLGSRSAGRKLVMLAKTDPDPAVRHAAMMAGDLERAD